MIIRISGKLGKKIHVSPGKVLPGDSNRFADWSAHLFTARRVQHIIVTNTFSLYSIVMRGAGITDLGTFLHRTSDFMREFLQENGFPAVFESLIAPAMRSVAVSGALNRSVTGSMNDLVYQAQVQMEELDLPPWDASCQLNRAPMSYLKYSNPRDAFVRMIKEHAESN
jgi:hypothetical protein